MRETKKDAIMATTTGERKGHEYDGETKGRDYDNNTSIKEKDASMMERQKKDASMTTREKGREPVNMVEEKKLRTRL